MRAFLVFAIFTLFTTQAAHALDVSGVTRGIPNDCGAAIKPLERILRKAKITLIESIQCVNDGATGGFVPRFKISSAEEVQIQMIKGADFSSASYCEMARSELARTQSADKTKIVFDSACQAIRSDAHGDGDELIVYRPVIVLMIQSPSLMDAVALQDLPNS
jgi:hypothetical protein